ncbi:MAG TPA: hypothetical protein VE978_05375 [Chitinophagales bacterium]|nr:hypothetical protein [Chitinophagales bacterium]
MKFKPLLLIMAVATLVSLNSCFVRVGGARVPRVHHERHGRGPRTYVQPDNSGLRSSFAPKSPFEAPYVLQQSAQPPAAIFTVLKFD